MNGTWRGAGCALPWLLLGALSSGLLLGGCGGGGGPATDDLGGSDVAPPLASFLPADLLFGQAVFSGQDVNRGFPKARADSLRGPGIPGPDFAGVGLLYVPDIGNHRVLGFDVTPVFNNLAANFVLGQPSFEFTDPNVGRLSLNAPVAALNDGGYLLVTDHGNHRIAIWDEYPLSGGAPMSRVLGQPDFLARAPSAGRAGLREPIGLARAGERLFVCDSGNHRVLIWNEMPDENGAPADLVLGQADFDAALPNRGVFASAQGMHDPVSVWSDGMRLVVADRGNNRVLIWLTLPTRNGIPADLVLGQTSFTDRGAAAGAQGLSAPSGVCSDGGRLYVADSGNNRVLGWTVFPENNAQAADAVIGQSDFLHTAPNDDDQDGVPDPVPSARTLSSGGGLLGVRLAGGRLFVSDVGNNRLLIYGE